MREVRHGPELRVAGRTLSGTAIRYGDISPDYRERFEPGAFGEVGAVPISIFSTMPGVVLAPSASAHGFGPRGAVRAGDPSPRGGGARSRP